MRLAELSERSGVSTATIKYYLREGLLPPGERVSATQAEYDEEHLRRLRLVRAMVQVGRIPVATAREVLAAVDDASADQFERMDSAVSALPHSPPPDEADEAVRAARDAADALLRRLDWDSTPEHPARQTLVSAIAAMVRLGYPCDPETLLRYGRVAGELAAHEVTLIERFEAPTTQLEAVVALTVLYEPVLLSLRRLAQAEEAARRFRGRSGA